MLNYRFLARVGGARPFACMALALLAPLFAAACFHKNMMVIVPVQETPAKQYAYAKNYQDSARIDLVTDRDAYLKAREVVIETYEKVGEYFPDDRVFTPLAKIDVVILQCGFDSEMDRLHLEGRDLTKAMNKAIDDLAALARKYPENDAVQAQSLYISGLCNNKLGNFAESSRYFKQVRDDYAKSENPTLKNLSERAAAFYNQVYTQ